MSHIIEKFTDEQKELLVTEPLDIPRPQFQAKRQKKKQAGKWYDIKAATERAQVYLYGEIGRDFFGDGIGAVDFLEDLKSADGKPLDVYIDSPGGDVSDGYAIVTNLLRYDNEVNMYIDGFAASIAGVIAMAGDKISIPEHGMFMMHEARAGVIMMGTADDIEQGAAPLVAALRLINQGIETIYSNRSGLPVEQVRAMMVAETWIDGAEAVNLGIADELIQSNRKAALHDWSPFNYEHVPQEPPVYISDFSKQFQNLQVLRFKARQLHKQSQGRN
jgi:ATP-dependent protease ClpP protease subunit